MSLAKILAARKRKRNFYTGGADFADSSGSIDSGTGGTSAGTGTNPGGGFTDTDVAQFGTPEAPVTIGGPAPTAEVAAPSSPAQVSPTAPAAGITLESVLGALGKMPGTIGTLAGLAGKGIEFSKADKYARDADEAQFGIAAPRTAPNESGLGSAADAAANPFGSSAPTQTTPAASTDAGMRKYVWDPVARQYTLTNVGAGDNPMGYTSGQTFKMAAGGAAPSGLAAAQTQPRFVQGGGTGLSDDVPVKMDDGGDGRLADGEFVVPADVVSGLGGGSSKAGADMLYQMMERIRQQAHGKSQQIRPVNPGQVLPA